MSNILRLFAYLLIFILIILIPFHLLILYPHKFKIYILVQAKICIYLKPDITFGNNPLRSIKINPILVNTSSWLWDRPKDIIRLNKLALDNFLIFVNKLSNLFARVTRWWSWLKLCGVYKTARIKPVFSQGLHHIA